MLDIVEVLGAVSDNAGRKESEFFEALRAALNALCEHIAQEVDADSAALFFVAEKEDLSEEERALVAKENLSGTGPYIIMRGASGRLKETFDAASGGVIYPTEVTEEFLRLQSEESQQAMKHWSVTNQIWHLGQGRIANSNRAMDELHGNPDRTGRGDVVAYPGDNLHTTFRTMISVPVLAQGKSVQTINPPREEKAEADYPPSASSGAKFLSEYRVIGILKVEGKRPPAHPDYDLDRILEKLRTRIDSDEFSVRLGISEDEQQALLEWCQSISKTPDSVRPAFCDEGRKFSPLLLDKDEEDKEKDDEGKRKALILRKSLTDVLAQCFRAEFTREDMELLVLLAMQVGRLITHRVIKYAADNGFIISENEVGLLNVRWRDINHLVAVGKAVEAATKKVEYHLKALKAKLDFDKRQEVYHARISELLDAHGPIRDVSYRTKKFISLVRKLARKQRQFEDAMYSCELAFADFKCKVEDYSWRSGERFMARGNAQLMCHRPEIGRTGVDMLMNLGIQGAPQVTVDGTDMPTALSYYRNRYDSDLPLVRRILDPTIYEVDDLAGVRVLTDYESDVDEVLDEVRAHLGKWNLALGKVDDQREGKQGGYRAVHITVYVNVEPFLPPEDVRTLREEAFQLPAGQPLKMPVEIQLRTAYQHSWALKIHNLLYKREEKVSQELRDEQEILSNVLAEADWLSDIVRGSIENLLLPSDYGERRLLEHLKRRIQPDDMHIVKFGVACAREMLKDQLRYSGRPEYGFAMEVCERLVYNFGIIDSNMLLLALLRNVWRIERGGSGGPTLARRRQSMRRGRGEDILSLFCERLGRTCGRVLEYYRNRLPQSLGEQHDADWFKTWMIQFQFPTWFWAMQRGFRDYFLQPPEDRTRQVSERLRNIYDELRQLHEEGEWRESLDEWLERAYVMEAAILLANLTELPFEPSKARRKRLHDDYLSLYSEIRRYLPNSSTKTRVIEELDQAFREIETRLDLSREPEWWGD